MNCALVLFVTQKLISSIYLFVYFLKIGFPFEIYLKLRHEKNVNGQRYCFKILICRD